MKKRIIGCLLLLLVVWCAAACGKTSEQGATKDQQIAALQQQVAELEAQTTAAKVMMGLYFLKEAPTNFYLAPEVREVPVVEYTPTKALEMLIAGPGPESGLKAVLPGETRLLGLTVKDGVATADFSGDIKKSNVGSQLEALEIAAIVNTLTKFAGIERVQLMIDGQKVESLAGHVDISEPLGRDDSLVEP